MPAMLDPIGGNFWLLEVSDKGTLIPFFQAKPQQRGQMCEWYCWDRSVFSHAGWSVLGRWDQIWCALSQLNPPRPSPDPPACPKLFPVPPSPCPTPYPFCSQEQVYLHLTFPSWIQGAAAGQGTEEAGGRWGWELSDRFFQRGPFSLKIN